MKKKTNTILLFIPSKQMKDVTRVFKNTNPFLLFTTHTFIKSHKLRITAQALKSNSCSSLCLVCAASFSWGGKWQSRASQQMRYSFRFVRPAIGPEGSELDHSVLTGLKAELPWRHTPRKEYIEGGGLEVLRFPLKRASKLDLTLVLPHYNTCFLIKYPFLRRLQMLCPRKWSRLIHFMLFWYKTFLINEL